MWICSSRFLFDAAQNFEKEAEIVLYHKLCLPPIKCISQYRTRNLLKSSLQHVWRDKFKDKIHKMMDHLLWLEGSYRS